MKNNSAFIESGMLESYILGAANEEEIREVEEMAAAHGDVREALNTLYLVMEQLAMDNAVPPPGILKPFILATVDFMGRMGSGETPSFPPILETGAKISDYAEWLGRPDMVIPSHFDGVFAKIIGYTPQVTTAIVWIRDMAPEEVHDNEYEKFLIVEGTCNITIDGEVHSLVPGDYLAIPLYKNHVVEITSKELCKIILQRVAA
jgi:mannose-6-phosphate isomerase-like protein (cupin superfamily)